MKYLVISDIHGDTDYIRHFTDSLGPEADYITPYDKQQLTDKLADESQYEYFQRVSSITALTTKARLALQSASEPAVVIGFNVGATTAWQLAAMSDLPISQCICVFGSRIRVCLDLKAVVPTTALFSIDEHYFYDQVSDSELVQKQLLDCPHDAIATIKEPSPLRQHITAAITSYLS